MGYPRSFLGLLLAGFTLVALPLVGALAYSAWHTEQLAEHPEVQRNVEYYFEGAEKRLQYPWGKGLSADSILAFHDSTGHRDATHRYS